jgi:hypothetical protein
MSIKLTDSQWMALGLATSQGAVFASRRAHRMGDQKTGKLVWVTGSTLTSLERLGYLTLSIGPDGGMMGRRTGKPVPEVE